MSKLLSVIGINIRSRRKVLGISQEELADLSGLHRTYIGGIERGERNVSALNIEKISIALKILPHILLLAEGTEESIAGGASDKLE